MPEWTKTQCIKFSQRETPNDVLMFSHRLLNVNTNFFLLTPHFYNLCVASIQTVAISK